MNTTTATAPTDASGRPVRLGLRENWLQFTLLVIVNVAVGGLVGLERTTVPLIGSDVFGLTSDLAVFSFIIAFGLTKALTNLAAGALTGRFRRKQLLLAGWLLGVPVPFVLAWAPSWEWIVGANVLLGLNQGLAWSMTVNMKIDLVGPARRGLATGLNEAAGYTAVGVTALVTGYLATGYGLRPVPALALLDHPLLAGILSAVALGLGTAMVYPALIASVSDHAHPAWRANALGTYRFWRDIGYAAGALVAGVLADALGLNATIIAAAALTAASGLLAARWITEHRPEAH
ncbi:MFS transporter [Streptomyces sp. NPDC093097]|uniref:MFS transporter n=1 Tax=Streptomyces sp. NPDC093097 TaxID=3366027 RepID=UPI00381A8223